MAVIDIFFVGLTVGYLWFGSKVDQWVTIAALGFKLETPQGFLEHPRTYDVIRTALLFAAAACLFGTTSIPWYVGATILAAAWFATTWIGQRRAFAIYRRIWLEGISDASTPEEKASREAEAKRTNAELRDRLLQFQKLFARQ
jgi:hypothetical protein